MGPIAYTGEIPVLQMADCYNLRVGSPYHPGKPEIVGGFVMSSSMVRHDKFHHWFLGPVGDWTGAIVHIDFDALGTFEGISPICCDDIPLTAHAYGPRRAKLYHKYPKERSRPQFKGPRALLFALEAGESLIIIDARKVAVKMTWAQKKFTMHPATKVECAAAIVLGCIQQIQKRAATRTELESALSVLPALDAGPLASRLRPLCGF